jgi:hypothetical protein
VCGIFDVSVIPKHVLEQKPGDFVIEIQSLAAGEVVRVF